MMQRAWWLVFGLLVMLVCYHMPWYVHDTAGFTMHGFDLAEWTSLHPAVRNSSPAMLTSFLLRVPLWSFVFGFALLANDLHDPRWRWVVRAGALSLVLRFIPPQEFFTGSGDDPNYRQMALLALLGVAAVLVAPVLTRSAWWVQDVLLVLVLVSGIVAAWWGLSRTHELLTNFAIDVRIGLGIIGYTVLGIAAALAVAGRLLAAIYAVRARRRSHAVGSAQA